MKDIVGRGFVMIFTAILINGCSNEVSTRKLETASLSSYKTYAVLPPGNEAEDWYNDEVASEKILKAVNNEMSRQGYELSVKEPELLVLVHTSLEPNYDVNVYPSSYPYYEVSEYNGLWYDDYYYPEYDKVEYVYGPTIRSTEFLTGTLIIDIIDKEESKIIWRGVATEKEFPDGDMVSEMVENVEDVFEEFPKI